jgi:hypothetical protein
MSPTILQPIKGGDFIPETHAPFLRLNHSYLNKEIEMNLNSQSISSQ